MSIRNHRRRRKQKPLQIIFPKPVRRLRANPEYIDRAKTRSKALVGNLTGKHVAGSLGGAAATIAVPNAMRLKGWSDVMASGAVSIGGGIAVKQIDEAAGDAFMLTGLGVTGLKAVKQLMKKAKGGTTRKRRRRTARRSLGDYELDGIDDFGIDDFGQEVIERHKGGEDMTFFYPLRNKTAFDIFDKAYKAATQEAKQSTYGARRAA